MFQHKSPTSRLTPTACASNPEKNSEKETPLVPIVIFVDVDDTFVRSVGNKRIPIPTVIRRVRTLKEEGADLYCWSSGGADYARTSAEEFGIADCFTAFLPKPQILLDDQSLTEWRNLRVIHPSECDNSIIEE